MALSRRRQLLSTVIAVSSVTFFFSVALVAHNRFAPVLESLLIDPELDLRRAEREQEQEQETILPFTENAARALINSVRDASREVAEALGVDADDDITAEEVDEWNRANPCKSRASFWSLYEFRTHRETIPPNPLWEELLSEYTKLHRLCTVSIDSITDHFLTGKESSCKFAISNVGKGEKSVGGKFLVNAAILLYAILTKRVLLVASTSLITECTCEPFLGSSWVLDAAHFPLEPFPSVSRKLSWTLGSNFFHQIDRYVKESNVGDHMSTSVITTWRDVHAVHMTDEDFGSNSRFFCQTEQNFLSEVTWLQFSSHSFSIAKLFVAPPFLTTLDALFPNRIVGPYLFRTTHLPSNSVWEQALPIPGADGGDRIVGVQVSSISAGYKRKMHIQNERVINCTRQNSILPDVNHNIHPTLASRFANPHEFKRKALIEVYIASPTTKLLRDLSNHFMLSSTVTGEEVTIVQISHSGSSQKLDSDVEENQKALAEVIVFSFSDQLVVTPGSAFGRLALAYGGQTPWLLETREDGNLPACKRGRSAEFCITSHQSRMCPNDPAENGISILGDVQHGEDCIRNG